MLFVSYVVNFVVADTVEFALTVLIFSFIVKAEIHPEVVNTEKILYTVRRGFQLLIEFLSPNDLR